MNNQLLLDNLRCIPDWPIKGVNFRDVSTLFKNPESLKEICDEMYEIYKDKGITKIVGIESRGFVMSSALAIRLAPPGKRAQALSLIATGTALAMVFGIPIGRIIGQYFGWRTTFLAIGLGALVTLVCLFKLLPKLPSEHSGSLKSLPVLFRRPALLSIYLLTVIVVTAHYTAYSYIEPFVQTVAGMSGNFATVLLLILGGAGIIGSVLFGKLGNQHASGLISIAIGLLLVSLLLLLPASQNAHHLMVLSIFWGIAIMIIGLGMQVKVLALAPDATDVAMSLFSGIFNIGIGAGALVGSQVSTHLSMDAIGYVGAIPALVALVWSIMIFRRWPVSLDDHQPHHS